MWGIAAVILVAIGLSDLGWDTALAFFVAPVIFFLNVYYCRTVIPKEDKIFYPSTVETGFAWLSLMVFTGMSAILILQRVFGVSLF